ncbi:MAG TPA: hypothetical protein VK387_09230 [Thermoleophilaceae bacterium]|nr:hypothetical protein [Thermoleophilaceae bacterium]
MVCKLDSEQRILNRVREPGARSRNLSLLDRCRYRHIQQAVNAAGNGHRILILPGAYREEPSRRVPNPDPRCSGDYESGSPLASGGLGEAAEGDGPPTYAYQRKCPQLAEPDRPRR